MMNPRPIGTRKTVQLMVILTLLAWATQTLFHQWGYGGLILTRSDGASETNWNVAAAPAVAPAASPASSSAPTPAPTPAEFEAIGITLELRSQIKASGSKLTLRDVCRWSDQDGLALVPVADMVVTHLGEMPGVERVTVDQIKSALRDAGVNLSAIRFSGAAACAVVVGNGEPVASAAKPLTVETVQTSLKDLLLADVHERMKMTAQQVQVDFDPKDQPTLTLTSPRCRIDFDAGETATAAGRIVWTVVIQDGTSEQKTTIAATARAWEEQLVLTRPLSRGQAFLKSDLAPRRVLVDKPTTQPVTSVDDITGQIAARDLKRGDVLTARDTDTPSIIRAGQFMTVTLKVGEAKVETVATALDPGKKGSTIRARNEANGEIYSVRVTAPDAGTQLTGDDMVSTTGTN